jgi:hypothetical protein
MKGHLYNVLEQIRDVDEQLYNVPLQITIVRVHWYFVSAKPTLCTNNYTMYANK